MRFISTLQLFTAISPLLIGAWTSPRHKMNEVFDFDGVYNKQMPFQYQGFNSYADSARPKRRKAPLEQMADGSYRQGKIFQKFLKDFRKQWRYKELGSKFFQNGVISNYKIKEQLRPQLSQKRATSEDRKEMREKSLKKGAIRDETIKKQHELKIFPNRATLDDEKVKQYRQMFENGLTWNKRKEKQKRPNFLSNRDTSNKQIKKRHRPKFSLNQVTSKEHKPKSVQNSMTWRDRIETQQRPKLSQSREILEKRREKQQRPKLFENRELPNDQKEKQQPKLLENRATLEDRIAKQRQRKRFENGTTSEGRINEYLLQAATKRLMRRIVKKLIHATRARKSRGPFGITGYRMSRNAPEGAANLQETGSVTACPQGQVRRGGVCSCPYLSSWNSDSGKCECAYGTYEDQYGYCRSFF